MTMKSWKKEFYPKAPTKSMSRLEAIRHSLTKWIGLRQENLDKHNLFADNDGDLQSPSTRSKEIFKIDGRTCALCRLYSDKAIYGGCSNACPLIVVRDIPCDQVPFSEELLGAMSPYTLWTSVQDPEPMIKLLEEALKNELDLH